MAYSLWAFHHLRVPGTGIARGGGRFGARKFAWKIGAAGARAFAMPHRGCADFVALRLPRATGAFVAGNWPRSVRSFVVPADGRARLRFEDKAPHLGTARSRV